MKRKTIALPLMLICALLLCSCTDQMTAERLAEQFVEDNALAPEKMTEREFAKLSTTDRLNDSIVLSMQAKGHELYKKEIAYATSSAGSKLFFLRMSYVYEGDTLLNTFYLDEKLEQVVMFK